jgi:PTS system nitrogen regulatory IIA component
MQLSDVLTPDRIHLDCTVSSKKTLLERMAAILATQSESADEREIFESLCQRERLGSTGLGDGVAIPHGRNTQQKEIIGAIIRLKKPIDFDAPDHQPVDLFFALAIPNDCSDAHLKLLANIAEFFKDGDCRDILRETVDAERIIELMSDGE